MNIAYCEDYRNRIYNYEDKEFDFAIVDPEYGINATKMNMGNAPNRNDNNGYPSTSTIKKLKGRLNSGGGKLKNRLLNQSEIDWDNEPASPEYFEQLFRVSQHQIIFGGNYFDLPPTRCIICWDKMQPWDNFSQWEMAWTSFDYPAKMYRISNTGGANKEKKIHETQKPVKLYDLIYRDFVIPYMKNNPGKIIKVLDTHLGSGSHRITAYKTGVDFVGFEINPQKFADMQKRYETFIMQNRVELTF